MIFRRLVDIIAFSQEFNELIKCGNGLALFQKLMIFVWVCVEIAHNDALEVVSFRLLDVIHYEFGETFALTGKVFGLMCVDVNYFKLFGQKEEVDGNKPAILSVNSLNVFRNIRCYDKTNSSRSIRRVKVPVCFEKMSGGRSFRKVFVQ